MDNKSMESIYKTNLMRSTNKKFKLFLFENKITNKEIAELLNKRVETVGIKINDCEKFTGKEINIILKRFNKKYEDLFI